jgi:hypothetical protein
MEGDDIRDEINTSALRLGVTPALTETEKVQVMREVFHREVSGRKVDDLSGYLLKSFKKLDGFNYRWNSLITSSPLLFEDVDYTRVRGNIDNRVTDEEREAYRRGELRELYVTFESMLMCNLKYFDRIMRFCTIAFNKYVRLDDEETTTQHMEELPIYLTLTPTQAWCAAMVDASSTPWEIEHGWGLKMNNQVSNKDKSPLESNWEKLYKNPVFNMFVKYSDYINETSNFRECKMKDVMDNRKLSRLCQKFTSSSAALSEDQLSSVFGYVEEIESITRKLYDSLFDCLYDMFNGDETQFAIYVYTNEFIIHSSKFSIKVSRDEHGKIMKEYTANSFECFLAEEGLIPSMRAQIEWARYFSPNRYNYDKNILVSLLAKMLKDDYKSVNCLKRMNRYGVVSKITFSGIFNNVYITEEFLTDNRVIRTSKVCMSKENAARYVVNRGYWLFGNFEDAVKVVDVTRDNIVSHYTNYCVPVMHHMKDVLKLYQQEKNAIIDILLSGNIHPSRLSNKDIKFSTSRKVDARALMMEMAKKADKDAYRRKKTYWRVMEDST